MYGGRVYSTLAERKQVVAETVRWQTRFSLKESRRRADSLNALVTPTNRPDPKEAMRNCLALLLAIASLPIDAAAPPTGSTLDRIRQSGQIVIAHREASVPLSYLDQDKLPIGYAVELCQRIAKAVQQRLQIDKLGIKYLMVTGSSRIPAIVEGKADMECGSTTNNAERRKLVAFTVPHYITGARYLVRSDSPIEDLAGFSHKKLASTRGTTPLEAVKRANADRLLAIDVVETPDHDAAIALLEQGKVDGFVMDDVLLYGLRARLPKPERYKVVGQFLTVEALAIMFSKDDPEFKRIVDEEMKRLISSKEANAIYAKWFLRPIPPQNASLDMPMNYLLKDFWKYPSDWVPN